MIDIVAKISGIVFSNRNMGFYILKATIDGKRAETISIKGNFSGQNVAIGLKANFTGDWFDDPKYGRQFLASRCEILPEQGRNGIVAYLQANVPSVGAVTAAKIYDALGDDLVNILNSEPEKIRELAFLTRTQSDAIVREWTEASDNRTAAIFLTDLGLTPSQIKTVFTKWGVKTKDVVKEDPYQLYGCPGVSFAAADTAARKIGVGVDDMKRVRTMIRFALHELSTEEGHMFCTSKQIMDYVIKKVFRKHGIEAFTHGEYMSDSHFYSALASLQELEQVVSVDDRIYLSHHWDHESTAAECVAEIVRNEPRYLGDLASILAEFEKDNNIVLSDEQRSAFMMLEKSRVCVISGYPGTGKTTLVSAFVNLFEKAKLDYKLMSPTGVAAKRLSQTTGKIASTVHRALGYQRDETWTFNAGNKYHVDAICLDESSMLDSAAFFHLISALPSTTIIIFIGDVAQLPSVGAGYVLNNLMSCPDVPHVSLTRVYRQAKQSDIIGVAHQILRGDKVDTSFNRESEFIYLNFEKDRVLDEICKMSERLKSQCESTGQTFQVIAPMYAGDLGVDNLNRKLREILNTEFIAGNSTKLKNGSVDFYEGDRVMIVKNDYERMVYNGDVGKIQRISPKQDEIEVKVFNWFDQESPVPRYVDKTFTFKVEEARHSLKVAYACTVHKTQSQEYDFVVMPMTMQYGSFLLFRNLIYTAITRAKKKVFIFGDPNAFHFAISNDRELTRNSNLGQMICDSLKEEPPVSSSKSVSLDDSPFQIEA